MYLLAAIEEEFVRIDAVHYRTPEERYPMEDKWWFGSIRKEELIEDVQDDREDGENGNPCSDGECQRPL